MPLINHAVDVEPCRAYKTVSKKEMERRLDRSFGVIERILSARISSFNKAKTNFNSFRDSATSAYSLID